MSSTSDPPMMQIQSPSLPILPTPEPELIRLLDSSEHQILGSVPTNYEDPFSLESFGDLIKAHHSQSINKKPQITPSSSSSSISPSSNDLKKALIIARVQTWDPKQPEKAYYSYYNAFHLNRILFNTQVYLGKKLIHRMHVLNPLTNSDIIGHVLYFIVLPNPICMSPVTTTTASSSSSSSSNPSNLTSSSQPSSSSSSSSSSPSSSPKSSSSPSRKKPTLSRLRIPSLHSPSSTSPNPLNLPPPSASVLKAEKELPNWTLAGQTVNVISEEEYQWLSPSTTLDASSSSHPPFPPPLPSNPTATTFHTTMTTNSSSTSSSTKSSVAQSARRLSHTAIHLTKRFSAISPSLHPPPPPPTSSSSTTTTHPSTFTTPSPMIAATAFTKPSHPSSQPRPLHLLLSSPKSPSTHVSPIRKASAFIPPSSSASFSPSLAKRLSSTTTAGPESGSQPPTSPSHPFFTTIDIQLPTTPLYLNAYPKIIIPQGTITQFSVPVQNPSLLPRPSLSSSSTTTSSHHPQSQSQPQQLPPPPLSLEKQGSIPSDTVTSPTSLKPIWVYQARLLATDTDYLESYHIRSVFRDHALSPTDVQLFELPEYKGPTRSATSTTDTMGDNDDESERWMDTSPVVVFIDETNLCDVCYPTPEHLATMPLWKRKLHQAKCLCICCILLALLVILIVAFARMKR